MNGKKKKNKKQVLDSGKVSNYLSRYLGLKSFNINSFLLLKFNTYKLYSLEKIKKE